MNIWISKWFNGERTFGQLHSMKMFKQWMVLIKVFILWIISYYNQKMEKVIPIHTNNANLTLDYLHFFKWKNVEQCFILVILFVIGFMCIDDYILIRNLMNENLHLQASLIYQLMHKGNLWILCIMEVHKPIDLLNFHKLHQFLIKECK